jgi:GNAT superfamily N-acetyltransferase
MKAPTAQLDNPFWHALNGPHARHAQAAGVARHFPADIAPFIGIRQTDALTSADDAALARIADAGYYFLGVLPEGRSHGWHAKVAGKVVQMWLPDGVTVHDEGTSDACRVLTLDDVPQMLALTAIAFPDYFRPRTHELGTYVGVFKNGQLVAMAGERAALECRRELSAICTHPDHTGRGHARRAMCRLLTLQAERGIGAFLHVDDTNLVARGLYESLGFVNRTELVYAKLLPG